MGTLTVEKRDGIKKGVARKLRANGQIPGIVYGPKLEAPINITLTAKELTQSVDPTKKRNSIIDLTIKDGPSLPVMVREFQLDALRQEITHVDLVAIDPEKAITTKVPVEISGKSPGVALGGKLAITIRSVTIQAKPANIPSKFAVSLNNLGIGQTIYVEDLPTADDVKVLTAARQAVVVCEAPRVDKKAAAAEAAAAAPAS